MAEPPQIKDERRSERSSRPRMRCTGRNIPRTDFGNRMEIPRPTIPDATETITRNFGEAAAMAHDPRFESETANSLRTNLSICRHIDGVRRWIASVLK